MNVIDLFSGLGGFSLGLERAGMKTSIFCEKDEYCQKVLRKHWPTVPIIEDIHEFDGARWNGTIDVICGGFPCQDISVAKGKNAEGISGSKSGLWAELFRTIREARPKFAIVENSPMLLVRGINKVLSDLASIGYDAQWHCIPAAAVGGPHLRDRIWIVAYPSEWAGNANERAEKLSNCLAKNITTYTDGDRFKKTHTLWNGVTCTGGRYWCETDAPILGVDDGYSNWAHRIRGLGNAVVPQIVEIIGRAIIATYNDWRIE